MPSPALKASASMPLDDAPSWMDLGEDEGRDEFALATEIMNIMEQGIIVWSADGVCELHNTRVFEVLEINGSALSIGTLREDFLAASHARGEFSDTVMAQTRQKFDDRLPFQFDRNLPSGRVVSTSVRPMREGGHVVTFTDVTEARQAANELDLAKKDAEAASQRANAILEEERARQAEARLLADLDEWLQSCKSLAELYMIVNKFMALLLPDTEGELYIYSNSRDVLDGVCDWGAQGAIHAHIAPDSCWALRRGRAYTFTADGMCFACDHVDHGASDHDDSAADYICVPIVAHGDTVGLLHVRFAGGAQSPQLAQGGAFAVRCAEHISMAIANVKLRDELHDQSIRDPLTGLYNRRYFMDAMRRESAVADRGGAGFGLISFDADKFKRFNDNHGHEAGDMVLRALAEKMRSEMPSGAVCARIGGEEFAILLPGTDHDAAVETAQTLCKAVAATEVRTAFGLLPPVTISAGVAAYSGEGTPPSVLMKRADEALYEAKAAGRDRVVAAATSCDHVA